MKNKEKKKNVYTDRLFLFCHERVLFDGVPL